MIKKLIKYLVLKYKNRKIYSTDVSIKSDIGTNIEIGKYSSIDGNTVIGDYTYIGKNCNITKSKIGRYCSIANNVSIGQGEHDLKNISTCSLFYDLSYDELTKKPCVIKDDVWIGTDVVILRGVKIGMGSVIGANSVVTRDVPPFSVVVGSPAKVIKYRFDEKKRKSIIESEWWKKELNEAKVIIGKI